MSKYALDRHKRAARAFGYALTLGDESAWDGFAVILLARLTDRERGALAYTALRSLSTEQAMIIASLWTGEDA